MDPTPHLLLINALEAPFRNQDLDLSYPRKSLLREYHLLPLNVNILSRFTFSFFLPRGLLIRLFPFLLTVDTLSFPPAGTFFLRDIGLRSP